MTKFIGKFSEPLRKEIGTCETC